MWKSGEPSGAPDQMCMYGHGYAPGSPWWQDGALQWDDNSCTSRDPYICETTPWTNQQHARQKPWQPEINMTSRTSEHFYTFIDNSLLVDPVAKDKLHETFFN